MPRINMLFTHIKPERDKNKRAVRRLNWWLHAELAPAMRTAISKLSPTLRLRVFRNIVYLLGTIQLFFLMTGYLSSLTLITTSLEFSNHVFTKCGLARKARKSGSVKAASAIHPQPVLKPSQCRNQHARTGERNR
jgi:hypothetical protein